VVDRLDQHIDAGRVRLLRGVAQVVEVGGARRPGVTPGGSLPAMQCSCVTPSAVA
jgi:hypothetical protein